MPLYLREPEVAELLPPAAAVDAVEACFGRLAAGRASSAPRLRLPLSGGRLAAAAAADRELGLAAARAAVRFRDGGRSVLALFPADRPETLALVEADLLAALAGAAASAVAARHLARAGARTLGVIGCGRLAEAHVGCLRAALPALDRVVAYCRDRRRLESFCTSVGAEAGPYNRDAAEQDVVVTATTSRDPVVRGEWLRPGALVCAAGATGVEARELDNAALERAAFVCCDAAEQARVEAGDLVEPVERGVLDWLEVHELAEVVAGLPGRGREDDVVVFKGVGVAAAQLALAALALEHAGARGLGVAL